MPRLNIELDTICYTFVEMGRKEGIGEEIGGIKIEFEGGNKVRLTLSGGQSVEIESLKVKDKITPIELVALTVMRLIIPKVAPYEASGVGETEYRVEVEDQIQNLPSGKEKDYEAALSWAGAVLQGKGWSAQRVARVLKDELLRNLKTGVTLGSVSPDTLSVQEGRLASMIAEKYPGAGASIQRRRAKKIPEW